MKTLRNITMLLIIFVLVSSVTAGDWPRFRGPDGLGRAPECNPPLTWSATENIAWKIDLDVSGVSSPVIWGDKIFLTGYSGLDRWDEEQRKNKIDKLKQHVICLDTKGNILWDKSFDASGNNPTGAVLRWHGYASHTPVTDGEKIYAFFGTTGVIALDFDGNVVWGFKDLGQGKHNYGSGASIMLCDDKLIIPAAVESRTLFALNKDTGETVWAQGDDGEMWTGFKWGYSTPVIAEVDGKKQLVMGIMNGVAAYDAEDGHEIWAYYYMEKGVKHSYPSGSPFVIDGIAYFSIANSHGARDTMAIKLSGAEGDLTKESPNVLWHVTDGAGAYVGGPIYDDGKLYFNHFGNNSPRQKQGFFCLDAKTGETLYWAKRIGGPPFPDPKLIYASGLLVKDHIIIPSVADGVYVIAAKPEFELVAHNKIEDDKTAFSASPVPLDDSHFLLRSDKALYCIGK